MLFVIFALLTFCAIFSVLWPLSRRAPALTQDAAAARFYEAQLLAIARDGEARLISVADAENARNEAARRLLGQTGTSKVVTGGSRKSAAAAAVLAIIAIPAVTLAVYQRTGQPGLPDAPLAARLAAPPDSADVATIIAKVEAHLAKAPDDGRGFELIAPIYLRMGRADDAVNAYAKAMKLLGETPERRTDYAEAMVAAAQGTVTAQAKAIFDAVVQNQPTVPKARFYLGLAAEQAGNKDLARDIWSKMIADAPPGAAYVGTVQARLQELDPKAAVPDGSPAGAIAALPAVERDAAIRSMVDGLALRLAQRGEDVEGWLRLIRAYNVLHEAARARTALVDARKSLDHDAAALARINKLASELGLEG